MRTIDADTLKRKVQRLATETWKMQVKASAETILNQFIDYIDHAPTVDAVPVVRCKYCKHYHSALCYCTLKETRNWQPDDYCSSGRREGR